MSGYLSKVGPTISSAGPTILNGTLKTVLFLPASGTCAGIITLGHELFLKANDRIGISCLGCAMRAFRDWNLENSKTNDLDGEKIKQLARETLECALKALVMQEIFFRVLGRPSMHSRTQILLDPFIALLSPFKLAMNAKGIWKIINDELRNTR